MPRSKAAISLSTTFQPSDAIKADIETGQPATDNF